jgi:hypothetical protein
MRKGAYSCAFRELRLRTVGPAELSIMSYPIRRKVADQVLIQLIEADVDIGFGLIDEAKAYLHSGQPDFSSRALQNAAEIVIDIERRLLQLSEVEAGPFLPLVAELRNEIAVAGKTG